MITTGGSGYSSSCPHCNPRCPHGYPSDYQYAKYWLTNDTVNGLNNTERVQAFKASMASLEHKEN